MSATAPFLGPLGQPSLRLAARVPAEIRHALPAPRRRPGSRRRIKRAQHGQLLVNARTARAASQTSTLLTHSRRSDMWTPIRVLAGSLKLGLLRFPEVVLDDVCGRAQVASPAVHRSDVGRVTLGVDARPLTVQRDEFPVAGQPGEGFGDLRVQDERVLRAGFD